VLAAADLPFYTAPEACLRGIKALLDYRRRLADAEPPHRPAGLEAAHQQARAALEAARAAGQQVLSERESAPLLAAYGLPLVESRFAASAEVAVAAAEALGYPVVLKADVAGLAHKARVGGVRLGLADGAAVAAAFESLRAAIERAEGVGDFRGALVQPEAPSGLEAVLGIAEDPQLGAQVLAGLGGAHAEALAQVAVRLAPLRRSDAADLLAETPLRTSPGQQPLTEAILRLGWFAADLADLVVECDLNPVRLCEDRVLALDALIVLRGEPEAPSAEGPAAPTTTR
jgi:acetyltransferase